MKLENSYGERLNISAIDYLKYEQLAFDQLEMATNVAHYLDIDEEKLLKALFLAGFKLDDAPKQQKKIVRLAHFWRVGFSGLPNQDNAV